MFGPTITTLLPQQAKRLFPLLGLGGIVGAVLGSGALPVVGTLVGGLAGAFGGAVLGEYLRDQQLEPSLRIGVHATVGKLLATTVKFGLSVAGTVLAVRAALTG